MATIRAARPTDLDAVAEMLRQARLPRLGLEDQFGPAYHVAEAEERLVGAIGVETWGGDGLLRSAVVGSRWQGSGIGAALVRAAIAGAAERGLRRLYLLTTTADGYFARFGFARVERNAVPEPLRRSPEFAEACPESAAVMALAIAAADLSASTAPARGPAGRG